MDKEVNDLVFRAKQGDSEAFSQIYDAFAQRIFSYIRLKVQNRQEAEDILQEVFIKAYRGLSGLSDYDLNFSAWLYRVSANTINDYFRKKYRAPDPSPLDETFDAPSPVSLQGEFENRDEVAGIRVAFDRLPPLYKQVLELRFIQDFSLAEIANILNKSNLSVRLIQFRALKKVRILLKEKYVTGSKKI